MPTKTIKLSIVSAWYNEEILAPLFLLHYKHADEIHIILDTATNDNTRSILEKDKRVIIHEMTYPEDGLDWLMKQDKVNDVYKSIDSDWVFVVDADEFLYKTDYANVKDFLKEQKGQIMWAVLCNVYRHWSEEDLKPDVPPLRQRRHGLQMQKEDYKHYFPDWGYLKPIVIRTELNPYWDCGCHTYLNDKLVLCDDVMDGVHWHMADPELAVKRRLQIKARQGKRNILLRLGTQNHYITEAEIRLECKQMNSCPQIVKEGKHLL